MYQTIILIPMNAETIFEKLWIQYSSENPSTGAIYDLFRRQGESILNDHVAFRTFQDPRVGIDVLARPFIKAGYEPRNEYFFAEKKLKARHYELPGSTEAPRVFISELMPESFSAEFRKIIEDLLDGMPDSLSNSDDLILQGSIFKPLKYTIYERLREESEYAAWVYSFGFRANHFTVSVNHLEKFRDIRQVNDFLKQNGFRLNSSGGEVKGSPEAMLEQSSTLADHVEVSFQEGPRKIPGCYYEFAQRYPDSSGRIFSGFIADSADKIFESTHFRER
jgi:hypothetical protein